MSFKYKFYALVGSIVFAWFGYQITSWCDTEPLCLVENGALFDYHWFMYAGVIAFLVCALNFFLGGITLDDGSFLKEVVFRKPTQEDYDALYKPLKTGYEPEEIEAERQAHNENYRSAALWGPEPDSSASYIDYDGYKRNAQTNELMYMNKNNKGNKQ